MLGVGVMPVIFMEHIFDVQLQNVMYNVLNICGRKTDSHIVKQHS
ncbi:hypothetical protein BN189_4440001 [Clostridioides difficile T10]|nr:hypothetical protein BN189_4440001 [Clostridioides difficile T10]